MFPACFCFCLIKPEFVPIEAELKLIEDEATIIEDKNILDEDIISLDEGKNILDGIDFMQNDELRMIVSENNIPDKDRSREYLGRIRQKRIAICGDFI